MILPPEIQSIVDEVKRTGNVRRSEAQKVADHYLSLSDEDLSDSPRLDLPHILLSAMGVCSSELVDRFAKVIAQDDLIFRLRKRAEIRRQIPKRKSVEEGKPDRIAELLDEAATEIERLRKK